MAISIQGLEKGVVLKALYDHAKPQGMGLLHYRPSSLTDEQTKEILAAAAPGLSFDYVGGRVLKVDISGDAFDEWLYDRDNGAGAAAKAIASVRGAQ